VQSTTEEAVARMSRKRKLAAAMALCWASGLVRARMEGMPNENMMECYFVPSDELPKGEICVPYLVGASATKNLDGTN
jgi:hypothetical protein